MLFRSRAAAVEFVEAGVVDEAHVARVPLGKITEAALAEAPFEERAVKGAEVAVLRVILLAADAPNRHLCAFDRAFLEWCLGQSGFGDFAEWDPRTMGFIHDASFDELDGRRTSLNVTARKLSAA